MTTKDYRQALLLLGLIALLSGAHVAFAAQAGGSAEGAKEVEVEDEVSVIPSGSEDGNHLPASPRENLLSRNVAAGIGALVLAALIGIACRYFISSTRPSPLDTKLLGMINRNAGDRFLHFLEGDEWVVEFAVLDGFKYHDTKEQRAKYVSGILESIPKLIDECDPDAPKWTFFEIAEDRRPLVKVHVRRREQAAGQP